jgi:Predicted enzyme related to lactoylglutathione lyase
LLDSGGGCSVIGARLSVRNIQMVEDHPPDVTVEVIQGRDSHVSSGSLHAPHDQSGRRNSDGTGYRNRQALSIATGRGQARRTQYTMRRDRSGHTSTRRFIMARPIHFELTAIDPARAITFYKAVLGWTIEPPGEPVEYYLITTGPTT